MLATALRSLILLECEGEGSVRDDCEIAAEFPLEGQATSLCWETLSQRIVVAVNGPKSDRLCFCDAGDESLEDVSLPSGARALDLSFFSDPERRKSWVAVACSDGAVRLVDTSPQRAASVVRTSYAHGVEATAVAISREGKFLASGSSSGHVVLRLGLLTQPFHGSGPTPLPGMLEADEAGIEALCYSSLRQELLAASDQQGNLQVWDAEALRHSCRFPMAHRGPARGLSFSTQNSDLLITGGNDAELIFWDVKTLGKKSWAKVWMFRCDFDVKEYAESWQDHVSVESGITSLSYHSGGYLLASGTTDGAVLIFDLRTLVAKKSPAEPLQRFTAHSDDGGALRAISFMDEVKLKAELLPVWLGQAWMLMSEVPFRPKVIMSGVLRGGLLSREVRVFFKGEKQLTSVEAHYVKALLQDKVPSYATIESMMERLSKRVSAAEADVLTSPVDPNGPASDMSRSSFTWPSAASQVPPLPSNERRQVASVIPWTLR
eukprot:s2707_g8.t2